MKTSGNQSTSLVGFKWQEKIASTYLVLTHLGVTSSMGYLVEMMEWVLRLMELVILKA